MQKKNNNYYIRYRKNKHGTDFVVGDLHGRFDELMFELEQLGFDVQTDRLFSVGDLCDRGNQSVQVIELIKQTWFHAIRGNHDQFILDRYEDERVMVSKGYGDYSPEEIHIKATGNECRWFINLDKVRQQEIAMILAELPYVIEVEFQDKVIGLVHAGMPPHFNDWAQFVDDLVNRNTRELALRTREHGLIISKGYERNIYGIDYTIHGHTCFDQPVFGRNSCFIDTFDKTGKLTVMTIEEIMKAKLTTLAELIDENTFIVSDTHFGHEKIKNYEPTRVEAMKQKGYRSQDEWLIDNWNKVVGDDDLVLHLGDFFFKYDFEVLMQRLKGRIILLIGNHDVRNIKRFEKYANKNPTKFQLIKGVFGISDTVTEPEGISAIVKDIGNRKLMFSHYPLISEDVYIKGKAKQTRDKLSMIFKSESCQLNLHGHLHSKDSFTDKRLEKNCSIERTGFAPVRLKMLLEL